MLMDQRCKDNEAGQEHERIERPFRRHARPTSSMTIFMPPAVTVAIPKTPAHNGAPRCAIDHAVRSRFWYPVGCLRQMPTGHVSRSKDVTLKRQNKSEPSAQLL